MLFHAIIKNRLTLGACRQFKKRAGKNMYNLVSHIVLLGVPKNLLAGVISAVLSPWPSIGSGAYSDTIAFQEAIRTFMTVEGDLAGLEKAYANFRRAFYDRRRDASPGQIVAFRRDFNPNWPEVRLTATCGRSVFFSIYCEKIEVEVDFDQGGTTGGSALSARDVLTYLVEVLKGVDEEDIQRLSSSAFVWVGEEERVVSLTEALDLIADVPGKQEREYMAELEEEPEAATA